jgi:hypothetical protein
MQPISPVLSAEFVSKEIVYAKEQPEYIPLPTLVSGNGVVMSRWQFTDEERQAIAAGADLLLSIWTFHDPLQPVLLEVPSCDRDTAAIAERMGLA